MIGASPKSARRGRRWLWIAAAVTVIVGAVAGRAWWVTTAAPAWWADAGRLSEDAPERAAALERGITRALHEPRPSGEPWSVALSEPDANAWLAHRLTAWAVNRGASWSGLLTGHSGEPPRVRFVAGRVHIGLALRSGWGRRVVGVSFAPMMRIESGQAALFASETAVSIGRWQIDGADGDRLRRWLGTGAGDEILEMIEGRRALVIPASISIDDGRAVSLVAVAVEEGRLVMTCVNEQSGAAGAP